LNKVLGVETQRAKSLTGLMFFVITVPLLAAGALSLAMTGSKIREIYSRAREHHREHQEEVERRRALEGGQAK
jgi:hypothetical protein